MQSIALTICSRAQRDPEFVRKHPREIEFAEQVAALLLANGSGKVVADISGKVEQPRSGA